MKLLYILFGLLLIGIASATNVNFVYINDSTVAEVYYSNGTAQYYTENNSLSENFTSLMVTGTAEPNTDLLDNPTIIYDKVLLILSVVFFAFMFLLVVWVIKKVLG